MSIRFKNFLKMSKNDEYGETRAQLLVDEEILSATISEENSSNARTLVLVRAFKEMAGVMTILRYANHLSNYTLVRQALEVFQKMKQEEEEGTGYWDECSQMLKKEYEYYSTWMSEYRLYSLDCSPHIERPEHLPLVDILAAACKITWEDVFELRRAYWECPFQFETIDVYVFKCEWEAAAKSIIKARWAIKNGMLSGGVLTDSEDEVLNTIEKAEKRFFKEMKTVMRKPTYGAKNNQNYCYEVEEMESYIEMVK
jgi:hypothetical protein